MSTAVLPTTSERAAERAGADGAPRRVRQNASVADRVLAALSSLRLTVALFALTIFLVFAGTLAQVDHGFRQALGRDIVVVERKRGQALGLEDLDRHVARRQLLAGPERRGVERIAPEAAADGDDVELSVAGHASLPLEIGLPASWLAAHRAAQGK